MIDYPKDFKGYPRSVQDIRSDKTGHSKDWDARSMLLDLLRDLDEGTIKPDAMMCVWRHRNPDGTTRTGFAAASPDGYTTCALFEYGKRVFFKAGPAVVTLMAVASSWAIVTEDAMSMLAAML